MFFCNNNVNRFSVCRLHWRKTITLFLAVLFGVFTIFINCLNVGSITSVKFSNREVIPNTAKKTNNIHFKAQTIREDILETTRSKIRAELQYYNFSYSGVEGLKDLVMESGGNPLRSVIVSTWRSGSTFLGELLNAMPNNFYNFEPFIHYRVKQIRDPRHAEKDLRMLKSLLKYKSDDVKVYFQYKKMNPDLFRRNTQLMIHCKNYPGLCLDANFTENFCKLFPFLTIKLIRLRLQVSQYILEDSELNVKLVLLVRDPRAVMNSRDQWPRCTMQDPDCGDPRALCADMLSDYTVATQLLTRYPTRFTIVRYENLALNPKDISHKLYSFLKRSVPTSLDEYINTHTKSKMKCSRFCTYRTSKDRISEWKHEMDFKRINEIQIACAQAMALWGYRKADNASHVKSEQFHPVDPYINITTL